MAKLKKLSEYVGVDAMKALTEKRVNSYYALVNEENNYPDDFNKFKNIEVLSIKEMSLNINWIMCKVKVERCGCELTQYLCIRECGLRAILGLLGIEVFASENGHEYLSTYIDWEKKIWHYCYAIGDERILEDYLMLLKSIREDLSNGEKNTLV